MSKPAIIVDNVSMKFNLSKEKVDSLKDYIIKSIKKEIKYNEFWALQNVSFTVEKGDRVGILGLNGAGKSTLLKVMPVFLNRQKEQLPSMERWCRFWNLVPALIHSIQEKRTFTFMEQCSDIQKSLLMRSMMKL